MKTKTRLFKFNDKIELIKDYSENAVKKIEIVAEITAVPTQAPFLQAVKCSSSTSRKRKTARY